MSQKEGIKLGKYANLSGRCFGHLKVIERTEDYVSPKGCISQRWKCVCECGGYSTVTTSNLIGGKAKSCGKCNYSKRQSKDCVGDKYGQLIVLEVLANTSKNGGDRRVVKVRCSCGNEFETYLYNAKRKQKCDECAKVNNRKNISGQRFGGLTVEEMLDKKSKSGTRVSYCKCICDCGNTRVVAMNSLVSGSTKSCGCAKKTKGLLKDNAKLMLEYDSDKNSDIDITKLTGRSDKKVWWKCNTCGNSWLAKVSSRNRKTGVSGCPYCSGNRAIIGFNDLLSRKPDIAIEWNYGKNEGMTNAYGDDVSKPEFVKATSSVSVWWKCANGHEWKTKISNRVIHNSGCPVCNKVKVNSFCEQALFYYIKKTFPDAINDDYTIGMELDVYIPSRRIGIEYDGEVWHKSHYKTELDNKKNQLCIDNGIEMIRIREPKLDMIDGCKAFIRRDSSTNKSLNEVIRSVLEYLVPNNDIVVDVDSDTVVIWEQYITKQKDNSILVHNPSLAMEWHPTKNGTLTPDKVSYGSRHKVWWLGKCGHEWQMAPNDRTQREYVDKRGWRHKPQGCPFCSGERVLKGFNDICTTNEEVVKEWHPTYNEGIKPQSYSAGSTKKVWWLCKNCRNEWQATICSRCANTKRRKPTGCPACFERKRSPAVRCVETDELFENGKKAADFAGLLAPTTIYKCCRGEQTTAGGYHWKYQYDT